MRHDDRPISRTLPGKTNGRLSPPAAAAGLCLLLCLLCAAHAAPAQSGGVELYGKPLRGLTAVPLTTIAQNPEAYRDRTIRVTGEGKSAEGGAVTISEGAASLQLKTDGSFSMPGKLAGARVTAEGRVRSEKGSGTTFVATGIEVKR